MKVPVSQQARTVKRFQYLRAFDPIGNPADTLPKSELEGPGKEEFMKNKNEKTHCKNKHHKPIPAVPFGFRVKQRRPGHRRLFEIKAKAIKEEPDFWLPILLALADTKGIKAGSTNFGLHLLLP